jgi:hypothetical protein
MEMMKNYVYHLILVMLLLKGMRQTIFSINKYLPILKFR